MLRCAPTVPAAQLPRGQRRRLARDRRFAVALPLVDHVARGLGELLQGRAELPHQVRRPPAVVGLERGAETHLLEQQMRGVATREVGVLVDRRSSRPGAAARATPYGSESLMNPGLLPVAKIDDPPRRHASEIRSRSSSASLRPPPNTSPRVVTTFVPDSSSATTSSITKTRGMYSTQSARSAVISAGSSVAATPTGFSPHSSPASTPALSGS